MNFRRAPRGRRRGERGIVRGCCGGLVMLLVLVGGSFWIINQLLASPTLGPDAKPDARDSSQAAIASRLAAELAGSFDAHQTHPVVVLSAWDLTVMGREHNPDPQRYSDIQAHLSDGQVLLSAQAAAGPLRSTTVVTVAIELAQNNSVLTRLVDLKLGQLDLPKWTWGALEPGAETVLNVGALAQEMSLKPYASQLECVAVYDDGVHLGFHRLGVAPNHASC